MFVQDKPKNIQPAQNNQKIYVRIKKNSTVTKKPKIKMGRFNLENSSQYYGCVNHPHKGIQTLLCELEISSGETINLLKSRLKNDEHLNLFCIGIFDFYRRHKKMPFMKEGNLYKNYIEGFLAKLSPHSFSAINLIDTLFADLTGRKDVDNRVYEITTQIAATIPYDEKNDGILYPSIKGKGGVNICIPPLSVDKKFEHIEVFAYSCFYNSENGLYRTEELHKGTIGQMGVLNWI